MRELVIRMANRPGMLASLAEVIAKAGVNIEALAAFGIDDEGIVRLLVDDPSTARRALKDAGIGFDEHEIVTTILPHRPGTLAKLSHQLAESAVNIEAIYALSGDPDGLHLAIAVDDHEAAALAIEASSA